MSFLFLTSLTLSQQADPAYTLNLRFARLLRSEPYVLPATTGACPGIHLTWASALGLGSRLGLTGIDLCLSEQHISFCILLTGSGLFAFF